MPELRKDPVIGRWVIISSKRGNRPGASLFKHDGSFPDTECPFCVGQEGDTPPEVLAFRGKTTDANEEGWWVRVVPNKYPAVRIEGKIKRTGQGMFDMISGVGAHEVVIETPSHDEQMADMSVQQIQEVLWAYRERMHDLRKDLRFRYVMIFKNHGLRAGATIGHSHSQIIALPIVPKRVQEELDGTQAYFNYKERCVYCDIITQEDHDKVRIVDSSDRFIAFHPYAARFAFETWILPRYHSADFLDIQMDEVADLATILKNTLTRFNERLNDPPFNYMIHTAPFLDGKKVRYHWHIELIPRLTRIAGFEWGTGFYINSISPEEATEFILGEDDWDTFEANSNKKLLKSSS